MTTAATRIYLDHNATTPLHPLVLEAMQPYLTTCFGNPSSLHSYGQETRRALDGARESVAALLGASPGEIVFTSGGTEANNQVIVGTAEAEPVGRDRLAVSAIEHQAVLKPGEHLRNKGYGVTYLPVDGVGRAEVAAAAAALDAHTLLVSVMLANNETGVLQPVREIAMLARERGIPIHTDAVQAAGKVPVNVHDLGVDYLTLSAHKINGPKGCGALYIRERSAAPRGLLGGHHERGRRAGTENVAAIVGFGEACRLAREHLAENAGRWTALRDRLEAGLAALPGVVINGREAERLPNTLNACFPGWDGYLLGLNLDLHGIAVSTGAACLTDSRAPSHVLLAMGRTPEEAASCLRFSFGRGNDEREVDQVLAILRSLLL